MKPRKKKGDLDVPMGPEAQRYYDEEFLPRLSKIQKEVTRTTLGILVWGPGPTSSISGVKFAINCARMAMRQYSARKLHPIILARHGRSWIKNWRRPSP